MMTALNLRNKNEEEPEWPILNYIVNEKCIIIRYGVKWKGYLIPDALLQLPNV